MELDATVCMCSICKKPTCGTCSAGISKITCLKFKRCLIPHDWSTKVWKRGKNLQFCFQNSVNVPHVDGINVICIIVPRLFSLSTTIYITIIQRSASVPQHLVSYIQLVDQLSEIVIYVRSFEVFCNAMHFMWTTIT